MKLGRLGVWYFTDAMTAEQSAATVKRVEELGYSAFWFPEALGRNSFAHASWLLANTQKLIVATGISSIYLRDAGAALSAQNTLAEQSKNRFLLGLGASHKELVSDVRGIGYEKPYTAMKNFITKMDSAPYNSVPPSEKPPRVIAALGPKMLELAKDKCEGAHPYLVSPEHTAMASKILGKDKWLCVEQKVLLEEDEKKARAHGRASIAMYLTLPNYRNNWKRMGFSDADFENGGSDNFVDSMVAWGNIESIKKRVNAHFESGATHVCVQPVHPQGVPNEIYWPVLERLRELI